MHTNTEPKATVPNTTPVTGQAAPSKAEEKISLQPNSRPSDEALNTAVAKDSLLPPPKTEEKTTQPKADPNGANTSPVTQAAIQSVATALEEKLAQLKTNPFSKIGGYKAICAISGDLFSATNTELNAVLVMETGSIYTLKEVRTWFFIEYPVFDENTRHILKRRKTVDPSTGINLTKLPKNTIEQELKNGDIFKRLPIIGQINDQIRMIHRIYEKHENRLPPEAQLEITSIQEFCELIPFSKLISPAPIVQQAVHVAPAAPQPVAAESWSRYFLRKLSELPSNPYFWLLVAYQGNSMMNSYSERNSLTATQAQLAEAQNLISTHKIQIAEQNTQLTKAKIERETLAEQFVGHMQAVNQERDYAQAELAIALNRLDNLPGFNSTTCALLESLSPKSFDFALMKQLAKNERADVCMQKVVSCKKAIAKEKADCDAKRDPNEPKSHSLKALWKEEETYRKDNCIKNKNRLEKKYARLESKTLLLKSIFQSRDVDECEAELTQCEGALKEERSSCWYPHPTIDASLDLYNKQQHLKKTREQCPSDIAELQKKFKSLKDEYKAQRTVLKNKPGRKYK